MKDAMRMKSEMSAALRVHMITRIDAGDTF